MVHLTTFLSTAWSPGFKFKVYKEGEMWEWTSLLGGEKRLLLGKLPELFEKFLLSFKVEKTKSLYIVCITLEKRSFDVLSSGL